MDMGDDEIPLNGGLDDEAMAQLGYVWCRPHAEYHRLPECPINMAGQPLMSCGCLFDLPEFHERTCDLWDDAYIVRDPK